MSTESINKKVALVFNGAAETAEFLRAGGATVVTETSDGNEGLSSILATKPDVAVIDLVLSGLDGMALLGAAANSCPLTTFVVYSAFRSDETIRAASAAGAALYLVRPMPPETLADRILSIPVRPKRPPRDINAEMRISNVFLRAGIPPHIKGFNFLRSGVILAMKNPGLLGNITKQLYPSIADEYETTPSKVERAIRHAIEVAWARGRIENLNSVFGVSFYEAGDKPTNGEFIALIADRLLQEEKLGKLL